MPKPSIKLIIASILLAPATILAVTSEEGRFLCLALYLLFGLVAILDLLISHKPRGVQFYTLKKVRQSKNVEGSFFLFMEFPKESFIPKWITLGVPFPNPITCEEEEQRFMLQADKRSYRTQWKFTSPQRGIFEVGKIFWQVQSRLGLWLLHGSSPVDLPIRIHPDLRKEKKALANLFMNRGMVGLKLQQATGQGRDFDQIRDYQAGDSLLDIHWKASAKRNSLMSKTYQIERTQEIYLVIDHSRLSARKIQTAGDDHEENVLERFISAANILSLAASRQGDLIGMVTFARYPTNFIRAGSGPAHLKAMQNSLFNVKPEKVFPDFDELLSFIRLRIRRRALVIFLTDLSDPAVYESFYQRIDMISRKHLMLVNMVTMDGVQPLFEEEGEGEVDVYNRLAGHLIWKDLNDHRKMLVRKRATLQLLKSENLAVEMVNQYLTIKRRQLI